MVATGGYIPYPDHNQAALKDSTTLTDNLSVDCETFSTQDNEVATTNDTDGTSSNCQHHTSLETTTETSVISPLDARNEQDDPSLSICDIHQHHDIHDDVVAVGVTAR